MAVEYDGEYYHRNKAASDAKKTSLCRSHGIDLIHIQELKIGQKKSRKSNIVSYYYEKNYKNIDSAIQSLCLLLSKKCGEIIEIDVDLDRDSEEIVSYIQGKYHKKTIAYKWPESEKYWLEDENQRSIYDVFYTNNNTFLLRCPYCQRNFTFFLRYLHHRKSLVPCECEYAEIERMLKNTIRKYKETGELVTFDDSLHSRRLYDRMVQNIGHYLETASKEEIEMYIKLGFESPLLDDYLTYF